MKYVVIYFTRTNTCKKIAEKISNKLSCKLVQITDNMNWKGFWGFLKAGYYSSTDKHVEIKISGNLDAVEKYILVAPLWAGGIAPTARTFLKTIPIEKVHLVVSSIGNHIKNRSGYGSVTDIIKIKKNENLAIDTLVINLRSIEA